MNMHLEAVSSGARAARNEDLAIATESRHGHELLVIDGATSVADHDYIDPVRGDVCWFVRQFASALESVMHEGLAQHEAVRKAIEPVYARFQELGGERDVPDYASPIAALSWVRARETGDGHRLALYSLGDCTILMRTPDGEVRDLDPFVNPQEAIVRAEVARLKAEGIQDPAARFSRLLPMLRARRVMQNTAPNSNSLCLRPNGAFGARTATVDAPAGSAILVMSDGFYRLVDTYGLHTPDSLFSLCMEDGLQAALTQLRDHETAARATAAVVKAADDASAVLWHPARRAQPCHSGEAGA